MKPSWVYRLEDDEFELKGCWARLWKNYSLCEFDKRVQVLILRQLSKITMWLTIIGVCSIVSTCQLLTL